MNDTTPAAPISPLAAFSRAQLDLFRAEIGAEKLFLRQLHFPIESLRRRYRAFCALLPDRVAHRMRQLNWQLDLVNREDEMRGMRRRPAR